LSELTACSIPARAACPDTPRKSRGSSRSASSCRLDRRSRRPQTTTTSSPRGRIDGCANPRVRATTSRSHRASSDRHHRSIRAQSPDRSLRRGQYLRCPSRQRCPSQAAQWTSPALTTPTRPSAAPSGRELVALGEVLKPVQVTVVVAGEDKTAPRFASQTPPASKRRAAHRSARPRSPPAAQLLDRHRSTAVPSMATPEGMPLPHQHAQLTTKSLPRRQRRPDRRAVHEKYAAGKDEIQVVGVACVPQQLAGYGMQNLTGRRSSSRARSLNAGKANASTSSTRRDE